MTPKQLTNAELLRYVLGQYGNIGADLSPGDPKVKELCNRFERLQAPLPEDLETWLQAMADKKVELTYGKAVAVLVPPPEYLKLTTTIRPMMALIKQLEALRDKEGQENAIFAAAMGKKNSELQAELQKERERLSIAESYLKRSLQESTFLAYEKEAIASDKANTEEKP